MLRPRFSLSEIVVRLSFFLVFQGSLQSHAQSPTSFQYFYDNSGQLLRVLDSSGNLIEYIYDLSGNVIQINRSSIPSGTLAIFSITPLRGPAGTVLKIFGQGFSTIAAGDLVQINGVTAVVISASATELDVLVPAGVTTGQITVTVNGVTVSSGPNLVFTAAPAPVITSITPDGGIAGTILPNVVVTGTDLTGASFTFPAGALATAVTLGVTAATLRISPITGRQVVPLVATTTAGSSTSSVTSGNHFIVLISPDEANTQAISVLNLARPPIGTNDPSNVSNQAMSAVVSLLNTSAPSAGGFDPTNISNQAMSSVISLLNEAPSTGGSPDATNVSNEADSYLMSLLNSTTAGAMVRSSSQGLIGNSVQAAAGGGAVTGTLSVTSSLDSQSLIAGQQLSLAVNPPANTDHVDLSASNSVLQRVDRAPYAFTLNVPETGETLGLLATAQSVNNTKLAASTWVQKIGPDIGTLVRGRVVDSTGLPITGAKVTVRAFGVFAEYFKVDSALGVGSDIKLLKVSVRRLESGLNWLNPSGVLGADPIGVGFEKYLAHFKAELMVENEGLYAFSLNSSGPAQLSLDGKVVDGPVRLAAGSHPLELSYLKSDTASLQLLWTPPGGRQSAIPEGSLIAEDPSLVSVSTLDGEFAISRVPSKVQEVGVRTQLPDGRVIDSTWRPAVPGAATDLGDIVTAPN